MTTNGVQLLKNQRMRSVQMGSQYKEKSKSNHGSASIGLDENESIEGILKAELNEESQDSGNDANINPSEEVSVQNQKNGQVQIFKDSRTGVPLPSFLAPPDAVPAINGISSRSIQLTEAQLSVREVVRRMEDLTKSEFDSEKLRRALMSNIREQQTKEPESRNWDMQTDYRVAYDYLKNLNTTIDQLFASFLMDVEARQSAGDKIVKKVQSMIGIEKSVKAYYQYLLKKKIVSENYLSQMYVGFSDSQNEKVKKAITDEKGNAYKMSKGKIGTQGKNDLLDSHVLVQQIQNMGKPTSKTKIMLGQHGVLNGAFKSFTYAELSKQNIIVAIDLAEHKNASKINDTMGKSIEYTFASNTPGSFYVTTSFDRDFVVDLFQIQLEDVVQLKNAMTRSWKPDGSNTTFNVAKLLGVLQKLTMQQLLLSYQPS